MRYHGLLGRLGATGLGILTGILVHTAATAAPPLLDGTLRGFTAGGEESGHPLAAPRGLATADFDSDGDLDVAMANADSPHLTGDPVLLVLLNEGDGSYAPPVLYEGPTGPTSAVTTADFDGDGDFDLALTQQDTITGRFVLVFTNDGDGTFTSAGQFPTSNAPLDIVAADFDGDGDIDLATTSSTNQSDGGRVVTVLRNDGTGSFATRIDLPTTDIPHRLDAGDLNLDGAADIAYSYWNRNEFGVLLSDGSGNFEPTVRYTAPGLFQTPDRVRIGDLDGDGLPDVVYGEYEQIGFPGAVGFFRNTGGGTLDSGTPVATVLERHPLGLDLADVDGDGDLDIAFTAQDIVEDGWGYVEGHGDGTFGSVEYFTVGDVADEIAIADANGDGLADAILTVEHLLYGGTGSINVHTQREDGFSLPDRTPVDGRTSRLDVADIDLDGDLDVVTAYSTAILSLRNDGSGDFAVTRDERLLGCMRAIRLADLDGDGFADLILTKHPDCPPYNLYTAFNEGDGTFGPITTHALNSAGDNEQVALDYDNDGDLDIAVSESLGTPGGSPVLVFLLDNLGDGTLAPARVVLEQNGQAARRLEAGDLNGDGNVDLIASSAGNGITVMLGDGTGTFPSITSYPSAIAADAGAVSWIGPADMNGDGHLDVAYSGTAYEPLSFGNVDVPAVGVMLGDGTGALLDVGYRYGPHGSEIEMFGCDVADFDGDGHLDVLSSARTNAEIVVFRGTGDGSLQRGERYGVDTSALQPHSGDFDGDGQADAAVVGWRMEGVFVSLLRATPRESCLTLDVESLVAGERATFTIRGGTPGSRGVTAYGFEAGTTIADDRGGYCATFDIAGLTRQNIVGGRNLTFDAQGVITFEIPIPNGASGLELLLQSAERGTCPDECVSDLLRVTVP